MNKLIVIVFLLAALPSRSFGFIVLTDGADTSAVLVADQGNVSYQACGPVHFTRAQLKKETADSLLRKCAEDSDQKDPYPIPEANYIVWFQSAYGISGPDNGAEAFSKLNSERIDTDPAELEASPLFDTLSRAQDEVLSHLGKDSHKIIDRQKERILYFLVYEGLNPGYFDGKRYWLVSREISPRNLDSVCPPGMSVASIDLILNSPSFSAVGRWVSKLGKRYGQGKILTWYRWNLAYRLEQFEGYEAKEVAYLLTANPDAFAWKARTPPAIPSAGATGIRVEDVFSGLGSFVTALSEGDQTPRRALCTRSFALTNLTAPPQGTLELEAFAKQRGVSWLGVARHLPDLDSKIAAHTIWKTSLGSNEAAQLSNQLSQQMGTGLTTLAQARQHASDWAVVEIKRLQSEIDGLKYQQPGLEKWANEQSRRATWTWPNSPDLETRNRDSANRTLATIHKQMGDGQAAMQQKSARIQQLRGLVLP